ncbi:hypothetical protein E2562_017456 [Oryza meyeriana var. granulata]|uniref:Uncharacterized protein n=1 Tax=Oryza meyeriana var. granulata TaxID=110450 RepID=A0A6G1DXP9_9ORYZ|nr:hypothetical protein E2562_017456 [Oryza meyeriana var. granulata]
MAKALVAFYPLAGRLRVDSDGQLEKDCNAEGALFVVAQIEEAIHPPPPHIEPASIVLGIKVAFLRCGGVALGTVLHHSAIDTISAMHFLQTWSAFCWDGDAAVVELPCHDRTLLRACSPHVIDLDTVSMFSKGRGFCEPSEPNNTKVFPISNEQLTVLKQICSGASTFSVVSALMWQCACIARQLPLDAQTCVSVPVNIHHLLRPPLPARYFGNAVIVVSATAAAKDIMAGTLATIATRIMGTIDRLDDKLLRSAIDYYNEMVAGMSSRPAKGNLPDTDLMMVS